MIELYKTYALGKARADYLLDQETGRMGLRLVPESLGSMVAPHRYDLSGVAEMDRMPERNRAPRAWHVDPLFHVALDEEPGAAGVSRGLSLWESPADQGMRFESQEAKRSGGKVEICTSFAGPKGLRARHTLTHIEGIDGCRLEVLLSNGGGSPLRITGLSGAVLGFLSPFNVDDGPGSMRLHRFRAGWSAEGREVSESLESVGLERSWSGYAVRAERFGSIGSKPTYRWHPVSIVSDDRAGAAWGLEVAWPGSWQMELRRQHDFLSISAGHADFEFGHWMSELKPGDSVASPPAYAVAVAGGRDAALDAMLELKRAFSRPAVSADRSCPVIFNEYCATWGAPSDEKLLSIADRIVEMNSRLKEDSEARIAYLVIDAGWYAGADGFWDNAQGDWVPSPALFPRGLKAVCDDIRARGLIPGIWFEFECAGSNSTLWNRQELFLQRRGHPIQSGDRRFLDFRKPEVHSYLEERVIALIERCGIGYLKIDYNETIGLGADGAESLGEGLRAHVLGFQRFLETLRNRLPDLVVENCSSGGQRLDAATVGSTEMSSFSDAHETLDIPIIAANVMRLIPHERSQVWVVLRADDDRSRLAWSMAAGFLGRLCLSGDLAALTASDLALVESGLRRYALWSPVLRGGRVRIIRNTADSWRRLEGWQAVVAKDADYTVVVLHIFDRCPSELSLEIGSDRLRVVDQFSAAPLDAVCKDGSLQLRGIVPWMGAVLLLEDRS